MSERTIWERPETIRCPGCREVFDAMLALYEGDPFPRYVADCPACGYMILESEWEPVEETPVRQPSEGGAS